MTQTKIKLFTIPNGITLLNLLAGCISIVSSINHNLYFAAYLIFLAGLFDFFDGFAARILKSYSEVGKQLDSLADVVSFGVAPAFILFELYSNFFIQGNNTYSTLAQILFIYSAFVVTLFSALRLAKFNIDERQSDTFIGVPTPANAFLIASFPFIVAKYQLLNLNLFPVLLLFVSVILSFLLISEIPLLSLKLKNAKWKENQTRYFLIISSVVLIALFHVASVPCIFIIYILLSVIKK